ncbi:TPA: glycosyltransferase family 2 protein [Klebsiella quasipneumoniae]|nr:glycosyltransferase family 2 protein [Klebsiella quasipneumoniae]
MRVYIAIPTYNGGEIWKTAAENIKKNTPEKTFVYVIDSGSEDDTLKTAEKNGFFIHKIKSTEFNHGGTRNTAVNLFENEFDLVIFLTQDAIPEPFFVEKITEVFKDQTISCAYGRQLPHDNANPIAQHARHFNYPNVSHISSFDDISTMGIKAAFTSNSFSAYRVSTFKELGGFPKNTILSEDMFFAAKSILAGYKIAYVANSQVKHSHNYSPLEEFKRYFDIGVFHSSEPWIRESFGGTGGEGRRYVLSEFKYLFEKKPSLIPRSVLHNLAKISGYKMGLNYKKIPYGWVKRCSMHKRYWND